MKTFGIFVIILIVIIIILVIAYNMNKASNKTKTSNNSKPTDPIDEIEIKLMKDLDALIEKGNKDTIQNWLDSYYNAGNKVPNKVYARARSFIEGKKWLTEEEYELHRIESTRINNLKWEEMLKEEEESKLISQIVKQVIDILLDFNLSTDEQKSKINVILEPYNDNQKLVEGIYRHSYWHSLHIIMNSEKVPDDIASKARSERQRNMTSFTKRQLFEFPIFDIKKYLLECKIGLTSDDKTEYQNFAFINFKRDFGTNN